MGIHTPDEKIDIGNGAEPVTAEAAQLIVQCSTKKWQNFDEICELAGVKMPTLATLKDARKFADALIAKAPILDIHFAHAETWPFQVRLLDRPIAGSGYAD